MQSMNTRKTTSKVLLVAEGRATTPAAPGVPIKRFRIARVRQQNRPVSTGARVEPGAL